jgi:hypothetical protein
MSDLNLRFDIVVNNSDFIPGTELLFNSYNQPSINADGVVVFRARSQGGSGQPATGIFLGDLEGSAIETVTLRGGAVPDPNNTDATFNEFPAFPRIDRDSGMFAFRGQSNPVYEYLETRSGTSGIYSNPNGFLITGASQLGVPELPEFSYYSVPQTDPSIRFDQFPGAPPATNNFIAFKGNWTDASGDAQTGVYFRDLVADGGQSPVRFIADSNTVIPGVPGNVEFGSTAPPSATRDKVVFLGVDNEESPAYGGIYLSYVKGDPASLQTVIQLGGLAELVGDEEGLTKIGEVLSFDGRTVAYWGAWGDDVNYQLITCSGEGNADRREYCMQLSIDGEQGGIGESSDGAYYFLKEIPENQGIFVTDILTGRTKLVASTTSIQEVYESFIFFNFSGRPPGVGEGGTSEGDEGDLELARWRESSFMAVDGSDVAFKAADLIPVDLSSLGFSGLDEFNGNVYIESGQGLYYKDLDSLTLPIAIAKSGDDGGILDPAAAGLPIVGVALERDSLRSGKFAFSASMAAPEMSVEKSLAVDTWAGIYSTTLSDDFNFVTGAGAGAGSHVRVFSGTDGAVRDEFFAYDPDFKGGVRVAQGQIDHDGIHDWITGPGAGAGPHVKVFSGESGEGIRSFFAYDAQFAGGVSVAAGDIDGDGIDDVITGTGAGAGPHVKVFSGESGEEIRSFFAYDPQFAGGVNVAAGDIDGDGIDDVITGAGAGAGPHVKVFSGESGEEIRSFYAYDPQFAGGVNVAAGDIDGDGIDDVITGAGAGAGPHVKVFSGKSGEEIRSFFAFDPQFAGGVTVAASDIDGDLRLEIVTGAGPGAGHHVKAFSAATGGEMLSLYTYDSAFSGGVFVA